MRQEKSSASRHIIRTSLVLLLGLAGCLELYEPEVSDHTLDMLSVDGFINASDRSVIVDIRHVQSVGSQNATDPETGAQVSINTDTGTLYTLAETSDGHYTASGLDIDFNWKYSLVIQTAGGREIRSAPIQLQRTSTIQSISAASTPDGDALAIRVSSDDNGDQSRYYVWNYQETYEYTVKYYSAFKKVDKVPVQRKGEEQIYRCWRTANSTKIIIGNTLALTNNTIDNAPVALIPKGTHQLSLRYSVLVRQRCVGVDEYTFLNNVRKTTEHLGGLFDPIPFAVLGNLVETTNLKTPVLGYFSGSEVSEKRTFVSWEELPPVLQVKPPFPPCEEESTCDTRFPPNSGIFRTCLSVMDLSDNNIITIASSDARGNIFSYNYAPPECADCRYYGGVTTRPDFW